MYYLANTKRTEMSKLVAKYNGEGFISDYGEVDSVYRASILLTYMVNDVPVFEFILDTNGKWSELAAACKDGTDYCYEIYKGKDSFYIEVESGKVTFYMKKKIGKCSGCGCMRMTLPAEECVGAFEKAAKITRKFIDRKKAADFADYW